MKSFTIILVSMSSRADWQLGILDKKMKRLQPGVVNRNYHVLQNLLQHPEVKRVISVDFLPVGFKKIVKQALRSKLWHSTKETKARGLTWRLDEVTPKWWSLSTLGPQAIKKLTSFIVPGSDVVIWSYHPFFPEVFELFPQAKKVFDTVDNWSEHPAYTEYHARLKQNYSTLDTVTDVIFTVSPDLKALFPTNNQVYWIPNGVDITHFTKVAASSEFNLLPTPFAVYCGIIQERFDVTLLKQTAQLLPKIHFVVAGPIWPGVDCSSLQLPNVHLIGPVDYEQLPNLLKRAGCGIIPHKVNRFTASMNPLKLYEYLAAGLPVVSTPIRGTEQFSTGVTIASTPKDFAAAIQQTLETTPEQREKLSQLISSETWEVRVKTMLQYLI